jgi:protein involved in polysaccharide export with SLBB domain
MLTRFLKGTVLRAAVAAVLSAAASGAPSAQELRTTSTVGLSLYPGDAVKLQIWQEPDLSGVFRVDENGVLTLPLLGARPTADLSADELKAQLLKDYSIHLKNPSIEVSILRRISLIGEVQKPGLYDVDPAMRVGDLVALAGGVSADGNPRNIDIRRDGMEVADDLELGAVIGNRVRAGDQVIVNEKSWFSQNSGRVLVAVGATLTAVLVREATR